MYSNKIYTELTESARSNYGIILSKNNSETRENSVVSWFMGC